MLDSRSLAFTCFVFLLAYLPAGLLVASLIRLLDR